MQKYATTIKFKPSFTLLTKIKNPSLLTKIVEHLKGCCCFFVFSKSGDSSDPNC